MEIKKRSKLNPPPVPNPEQAKKMASEFRAQQSIIYGSAKAGYYTRHIHPKFGVATDESNRVSL